MENNLCDSNILNLSQAKTIFREFDSLYEIYYFHKHFKNYQITRDIRKKHFYKIISDMRKAEMLKKKILIIIKLKKGNILGLYKNFGEKNINLIFDIIKDKIIYNDINYLKKEIKNDDYFVDTIFDALIKFNLYKIFEETTKEKIESFEIYGISLLC